MSKNLLTPAAAYSAVIEEPFRWAAVVPAGPGSTDLARLDDLLDSIAYYESDPGPVFILNDGGDTARFHASLDRHGLKGNVIPTPRAGRGDPWLGRLTSGLAYAYTQMANLFPGYHVIKFDTDALVTAPFTRSLGEVVRNHPEGGMIGSVGLTPQEGRSGNWFSQRIYRMGKKVSRWDYQPYFRTSFFGARAVMRRLLSAAHFHGYVADEAPPCGGAYLLTAEAIRRLNCLAAIRDDRVTAEDIITEDVFFSIAVHATGLQMVRQNNPGDVFGICWKGLPATSLPQLVERGHAIIHSVKDHGPFAENSTRDFFRAFRAGD